MGNCLNPCLAEVTHVELTAKGAENSKVLQFIYPQPVENMKLQKPGFVVGMERDATEGGDAETTLTTSGEPMKWPSFLQCFTKGGEDGICDVKESLEGQEEKGVLQVKIVLTEQEVAQLLSEYDDEQDGVLMDVVSRLRRIRNVGSWRPGLETIPEENM